MASIAESELEALPQEENPIETDYKLGEDGKRRTNSEDLTGSPNTCSPKLPKPDNHATGEENADLNSIQVQENFEAEKEIWVRILMKGMAGHSMTAGREMTQNWKDIPKATKDNFLDDTLVTGEQAQQAWILSQAQNEQFCSRSRPAASLIDKTWLTWWDVGTSLTTTCETIDHNIFRSRPPPVYLCLPCTPIFLLESSVTYPMQPNQDGSLG